MVALLDGLLPALQARLFSWHDWHGRLLGQASFSLARPARLFSWHDWHGLLLGQASFLLFCFYLGGLSPTDPPKKRISCYFFFAFDLFYFGGSEHNPSLSIPHIFLALPCFFLGGTFPPRPPKKRI